MRLRRLFQTASLKWIEPYFAQNPPGNFARVVISAFGSFIRFLQPNDQWNLAVFITEWSKVLDIPQVNPLPKSKKIFIFTCYRGQITQDILIAFLMAWRGHYVTVGYLPKLRSPIKDPLDDHPRAELYLDAVLSKVATLTCGRIVCINLSNYPQSKVEDDHYFLSQVRADIVMRLRQEKFSEIDPQVIQERDYYSVLGRNARGIALAYLGDHRDKIDLCLIANGASFENGYFCQYAKSLGISVNTHEKFAFNRARVVTHGDAFFQFSDLDKIWGQRERLGFLEEPYKSALIKKGWELLYQRKNSTGDAWGWQYQKASRTHSEDQLRNQLQIGKSQFALVCPNVPFDAGYDGWLSIFSSMRDWLVQTVEVLLKQDSLYIVVRAHPAETRPGYGREMICEIIKEAGLASNRLILLPGDSPINTYDLMPLCKFSAVFASTTGVEVAMHGKPVIAGASVYYARCGITVSVADRNDYFVKLSQLASNILENEPDNADNAAMLYFVFHYLLQWPFPYDKPSQISATPLSELVRDASLKNYIETLDILSMDTFEYDQSLSILFSKESIERRWGWKFFEVEHEER
jgi:hypothetical protein